MDVLKKWNKILEEQLEERERLTKEVEKLSKKLIESAQKLIDLELEKYGSLYFDNMLMPTGEYYRLVGAKVAFDKEGDFTIEYKFEDFTRDYCYLKPTDENSKKFHWACQDLVDTINDYSYR